MENLIKLLEKVKRDDVVDILKEAQALVSTKRTQPSFDQVQIPEKMPKIMYTLSPPTTNVRIATTTVTPSNKSQGMQFQPTIYPNQGNGTISSYSNLFV